MAYYDHTYTNGVIAVREKNLLKEKISRLCELSAEDAFRALLDCGYGGGAETTADVYEYEKLIAVEERAIDAFIREYAPSETEKAYLLSERDFHNAKALLKAAYLGVSAEKLFAPEGLISIECLKNCIEEKKFDTLENAELADACARAIEVLDEGLFGAKVGVIFERAKYAHLQKVAKKNKVLKKLLVAKLDMLNILIALRSGAEKLAQEQYLPMGTLCEEDLKALFIEDKDRAQKAFDGTGYQDFVKTCFSALEKGLPMTEAEKILDGYDVQYFGQHKYELARSEPFLYYVYRRKVESENIRVIFVCLLAGLREQDVKKRLRGI